MTNDLYDKLDNQKQEEESKVQNLFFLRDEKKNFSNNVYQTKLIRN